MILTEKETLALKELQQQEKVCMEHYTLCLLYTSRCV